MSPLAVPNTLLELEGFDGKLSPGSCPVGSNRYSMVAWLVDMKTPEYPEGREVFIDDDVTVLSGSSCVEEDGLYCKADSSDAQRFQFDLFFAMLSFNLGIHTCITVSNGDVVQQAAFRPD
jgi:hypothetical protein